MHSPCIKALAIGVIRRRMRLDSEHMLVTAGVTRNWEESTLMSDLVAHRLRLSGGPDKSQLCINYHYCHYHVR